jgi:Tfp pilus assembly ATPase PilU
LLSLLFAANALTLVQQNQTVSALELSLIVMAQVSQRLEAWLEVLVSRGGSDLFLVVGLPPALRVTGRVMQLDEEPLASADIEEVILSSLPPHASQKYRTDGYTDSSLRREDLGRFRVNLHHERGRPAATIRALPSHPPRLSELALPKHVLGLTKLPYGWFWSVARPARAKRRRWLLWWMK